MNKLIVFPVLIMSIIVLFGIMTTLADSPVNNPDYQNKLGGTFVEVEGIPDYWYYVNNATGHYYRIEGQGSDLGTTFNPSTLANQGKSFRLQNSDTDTYEYYNDYNSFLKVYELDSEGLSSSIIEDIFNTKTLWLALVAILGVSIVLGVKVFGSGLSEWSQKMVFITAGFGLLWAFLSIGCYDILMAPELDIFGPIIYLALTLSFIVGVITETTGGD